MLVAALAVPEQCIVQTETLANNCCAVGHIGRYKERRVSWCDYTAKLRIRHSRVLLLWLVLCVRLQNLG